MDKYNKLRELNDDDIDDFLLEGKNCIGKVVKIYDNIKYLKIILLIGNIVLKFNCYLSGVSNNLDLKHLAIIKKVLLDCDEVANNYKLVEFECNKFNDKGLLGVTIKGLNEKLPKCDEEEGVNWNIY